LSILTELIKINSKGNKAEGSNSEAEKSSPKKNFVILDNFIEGVFLNNLTKTTEKFIEEYTTQKILLQKENITDIKDFYNLYTKYHKELTDKDLTGLNIESLTQAETGKIMILENRVIKFILNMDESREGAQKEKKKILSKYEKDLKKITDLELTETKNDFKFTREYFNLKSEVNSLKKISSKEDRTKRLQNLKGGAIISESIEMKDIFLKIEELLRTEKVLKE